MTIESALLTPEEAETIVEAYERSQALTLPTFDGKNNITGYRDVPIWERVDRTHAALARLGRKNLPGEALAEAGFDDLPPDLFDVAGRFLRVHTEEIEVTLPTQIRVEWQRKARTQRGVMLPGKFTPIPQKERDLGLSSALFRLELALGPWLVMDDWERDYVLHHELMHGEFTESGAPAGRRHDIEEFGATARIYGYRTGGLFAGRLPVIRDLIAHPTVREWLEDEAGQTNLFRFRDVAVKAAN